jgi:GNAT superfamily N-acetyltransferase
MTAPDGSRALVVRRGRAADVAVAADVQRAAALAGFAHIFPPHAPEPTAEELARLWETVLDASPPGTMWVAELGGRAVGVAATETIDRETGFVSKIYVRPEAWADGIGNLLLAAALDHVRSAGCSAARLWVLEHNSRARQWYERHGWSPTGETMRPFPELDLVELEYRIDLA